MAKFGASVGSMVRIAVSSSAWPIDTQPDVGFSVPDDVYDIRCKKIADA